MRAAIRIFVGAVAAVAAAATPALAVPPPDGAQRYEAYFKSGDGTSLHAEILRPSGTSLTDKTPVIVSAGPYFNHSGQVGPAAPLEGTTYTPLSTDASDRFYDFLEQSHALKHGYSFVMVDLRGFGGSAGCNDWAGPGEQADVVAAVEWAGTQPWSTGRVGMYGKSYDGVTGIIGVAKRPPHLAAVVSQEPLPDLYRYLYMNGVRFPNSLGTPALYQAIDASLGVGDPQYLANQASAILHPECYAKNILDQQTNDPDAPYWKPRNLVPQVKGSKVPLYLQAGFIEDNTKPDAMWSMFNNVAGPKFGAFGMWDHVRGNDVDPETHKPVTGRGGFIDEVMRFYDHFLKGMPASDTIDRDPVLRIQTSDGTWRAEDDWPPKDAVTLPLHLRDGGYADDGQTTNVGTGDGGGATGYWTTTPPLPWDAHVAGMPFVRATVDTTAENSNLVADVYDIDPQFNATLISRGAYLIRPAGRSTVGYELYGDDWKLPAGHRVGVLLTPSNDEWWLASPSGGTVRITDATITLPFLSYAREIPLDGAISKKLKDYLAVAPFPVAPATVKAAESPWAVPAPLTSPRPARITAPAPGSEGGVSTAELAEPLSASIGRAGRRAISVRGRALTHDWAFVVVRNGRRIVARALVHVVAGRYAVRFAQRRGGTLQATVVVPGARVVTRRVRFVPH